MSELPTVAAVYDRRLYDSSRQRPGFGRRIKPAVIDQTCPNCGRGGAGNIDGLQCGFESPLLLKEGKARSAGVVLNEPRSAPTRERFAGVSGCFASLENYPTRFA